MVLFNGRISLETFIVCQFNFHGIVKGNHCINFIGHMPFLYQVTGIFLFTYVDLGFVIDEKGFTLESVKKELIEMMTKGMSARSHAGMNFLSSCVRKCF